MSEAGAARLFVAVDLPSAALDAIETWTHAAVGGRQDLRLLPRDSLHVTLCFLGERPASDHAAISAVLTAAVAASGPVSLGLGHGVWLPPGRGRVLALELTDSSGALAALQTAIADPLREAGVYRPEWRRFLPHVSVARVRGTGAGGERRRLPDVGGEVFLATAAVLYQSRLGAGGARYEALATAVLPTA